MTTTPTATTPSPRFLDASSPDEWHSPARRTYEGIPSFAAAGDRMWATWYASPTGAENADNHLVLATSGDGGATWCEAVIYEPDLHGPVRAFDPQLWIAPDARPRRTVHDGRSQA